MTTNGHHDGDALATIPTERPTDGCPRCTGWFDGFTAGPDGVDLAGNRHNFDPQLLGNWEYDEGAAAGLAARIERDPQQATT